MRSLEPTSLGKRILDRLFRNFVYVFLICMILAMAFCFFSMQGADTENPAEGLFFADQRDVAMDHFNSMLATADRKPYTEHNITYPPLAAMLYYFFFSCLNPNLSEALREQGPGTSVHHLREYASALVPYMLYVILCVAWIVGLIYKNFRGSDSKKTAATLGILLSSGFLSILDRGNNVLLVTLLLLYYVFYFDHPSKLRSETALIALALATGIKLYPIIFGVLLIRRHKLVQGFRTLGYIFLALFLPFFFFEGFEAIHCWITRLFPEGGVVPIHPGALNFVSAVWNIETAFGIDIPDPLISLFQPLFIVGGTLFAITYRKDYKALIFGVFAILGFAGVTFRYFLFLSVLPFMFLFAECREWRDRIYAILLLLLNLPLAFRTPKMLEGTGFFLPDLWCSFLVLIMLVYLMVDGVIDCVYYLKTGQWKNLLKTERQLQRQQACTVKEKIEEVV